MYYTPPQFFAKDIKDSCFYGNPSPCSQDFLREQTWHCHKLGSSLEQTELSLTANLQSSTPIFDAGTPIF